LPASLRQCRGGRQASKPGTYNYRVGHSFND
jgi:hypothetical protein